MEQSNSVQRHRRIAQGLVSKKAPPEAAGYVRHFNVISMYMNLLFDNPFTAPTVYTYKGMKAVPLESTLSAMGLDIDLTSSKAFEQTINTHIGDLLDGDEYTKFKDPEQLSEYLQDIGRYDYVNFADCFRDLKTSRHLAAVLAMQAMIAQANRRQTLASYAEDYHMLFEPSVSYEQNLRRSADMTATYVIEMLKQVKHFLTVTRQASYKKDFEKAFK